jgi:hypothetical protein
VEPRPGGGSVVPHRMALSGPLAVPIARLFGRALGVFAEPRAVAALVRLAERASGIDCPDALPPRSAAP